MAYGTVKVNFITFDAGSGDQTITVADLSSLLTSGITVTGAITAQSINATSGTFTNVSGNTGRINTLTGTTASFATGLFPDISGSYVQYASGQILNLSGNVVSYTSGDITNVSGDYFEYVSGVVTTLSGTTLIGTLSGNANTATSLVSAQDFTLSGDILGTVNTDLASGFVINTSFASGIIANEDISAGANIADTKLATISTAGKVSNSATTATSVNTVSTIVARDGAGSFSANVVTATLSGNCTGNAATATSLSSNRNFTLTGDISGTVSSDLATGFSVNTAISSGVIVNADINASAGITDGKLATISTAGKVANSATTATSANTVSTIVARDGLGDFSAGVITATLSGNASTTTQLSSARTFSITGDVIGSVASDLSAGADITVVIASGVIVNDDINAAAAIDPAKLGTGALPTSVTVASANIVDGSIVNDDINAGAGIVDTKLATITTSGKVANSATTATSENTASGIVARDGDGNFNATSINKGPFAGYRNVIINGNFDVWQRGTSITGIADGTYCADRWVVQYDGSGGSRAISQLTFPPGQTDVPYGPTYYLRLTQSVAGSGATYNYLAQRIEDVRTFAGQTVTLSFYAQASSAITLPQLDVNQVFGGGAGSSPVTTTITSNVSIGTSWAKYSYTFAVPSISGKTIGIDPTYLALRFNLPINSTFIFYLAQVQLELGPVATPFERRPIGVEEALCYRYFQRYTNSAGIGRVSYAYVGVVNSEYRGQFVFPVRMRVAPTISSSGGLAVTFGATSHPISSIASSITSEWGAALSLAASTTGGTVGLTGHFGLSLAAYLEFDAEV